MGKVREGWEKREKYGERNRMMGGWEKTEKDGERVKRRGKRERSMGKIEKGGGMIK